MVIEILLFIVVTALILGYIIWKKNSSQDRLKRALTYPEIQYVQKYVGEEKESKKDVFEDVIVENHCISSQYSKEEIHYDVIKPKGIKESEAKRVLILLHGIRDSKESWITRGKLLENYTELLEKNSIEEITFIIPNSGYNGESWYTNFYHEEAFSYEEFFVKEFLPTIKIKFPNAKMGITGFSMGGYGAFKIGLKNLEEFSVIGSMAGAVSLIRLILKRRVFRVFRYIYIPKFIFNKFDQKHFMRVFGSQGRSILKEDPYSILKRLDEKKRTGKKFYVSVGTEDNEPYSMFLQWIDCVTRLKKYRYSFKGYLYEGESHTWDYIAKDLKNFLKYFSDNTK